MSAHKFYNEIDRIIQTAGEQLHSGDKYWVDVLAECIGDSHHDTLDWIKKPNLQSLYHLQKIPNNHCFMEINGRTGNLAAELSADYEMGYSLEFDANYVKFLKKRYKQDNIKNIRVEVYNRHAQVLADQKMDLVAVTGGLRAIYNIGKSGGEKNIILNGLQKIRHSLVAGGVLMVPVNNRWNLTDRKSTVDRTRGSLEKTYWGYKRLLKKSGYQTVKMYLAYPDTVNPCEIYSFSRMSIKEYYKRHHEIGRLNKAVFLFSELLGIPFLYSYLGPGFFIRATA